MPSTFRIPKATITGLYGKVLSGYARRTYGQIPDGVYVYWHHRKVLKAVLGFEQKVAKWDRLDEHLKSYAQIASAGVIGCSWCLDFGYFKAHDDGLDLAKVREVPRWRESDVFSDTERAVIEYAEAMSTTPLGVTDEMVAGLIERLGVEAVVELTQMVALENMRSRFNSAAGLQSQGYSDVCELPPRRTLGTVTATDDFVEHRNLLFTVAYEMLGSAADAEDVLQETWLRWSEVDRAEVRDERAYLVRITTRLSLNRMRTMARRRESYVGPWLPEPLLTSPDVAEDVELADSISMAMLVVLEALTPTERAVFVLREVFDVGYDEIAAAVDKSPAAVRQIMHRARERVAERRPRGQVSPSERDLVLARFLDATATGDLQSLLEVMAPDVVLLTDAGGFKQAALRPILGRDKVFRFLDAVAGDGFPVEVIEVNGAPALRIVIDGEVDTVGSVLVEDGLVTGIYIVRNPEKLRRLDQVTALTR